MEFNYLNLVKSPPPSSERTSLKSAFTVIELLVSIAVIAILAALVIVSYNGVRQRAAEGTLQSDLFAGKSAIGLYKSEFDVYPTSFDANNCALSPTSTTTKYCVKLSSGSNMSSYTSSSDTFTLKIANTTTAYQITENTSPVQVALMTCPTGFIAVPGSSTYGTSDFCVMKYEAKNVGGVATSVAAGTPWVSISQNTLLAAGSVAKTACTGCDLITEAQWMTIAKNVISVASNWSSGTVGTGYVFFGHGDSAPNSPLAADTNDSNGYFGETNVGGNQRRTLTLTNGEVIWDFSGNVWEWTQGQVTGGQPGVAGNTYSTWNEWPNVTTAGTLPVNVFPSGTGIANAGTWNSTNGMGRLYSNPADSVLRASARGGSWYYTTSIGVFALTLFPTPSNASNADIGFRLTK